MTVDLQGKRVAVLSDNEILSWMIEAILDSRFGLEVVRPAVAPSHQPDSVVGADGWDLLVVGMIATDGETVAPWAGAAVAEQIGRVPLLIISDRRFESFRDRRTAHLDFPFEPKVLCNKVAELLREEQRIGVRRRRRGLGILAQLEPRIGNRGSA